MKYFVLFVTVIFLGGGIIFYYSKNKEQSFSISDRMEEYASIGVKEGNVRSCASAKCHIKFKVWKYTPVEILSVSQDKNWVEIKEYEGFTGWVHKDSLSQMPGISVKSDANVRTEPSSTAPLAWVVEKGYSFKFIKKQGEWLQVTDDEGTSGWISQSVVWGFTDSEFLRS